MIGHRIKLFSAAAIVICALAGCQVQEDSAVAEYRSTLKLNAKPVAATKIGDAQSQVTDQAKEVTIVGMADLKALPGGNQPKAVMLVREIIEDLHGHGADHDASSCAFCRRRQEQAPKAAVEFVGGDGKVLPYSVEKLFGLQNGDEVVVTGLATLDPNAKMLKVTAKGLYVQKQPN